MVLVVAVGDLHFKKDNSVLTDLVIHKIIEQLEKIRPDIVVLLGDILDTHEKIDMKTQNRAIRFIKQIAAMKSNSDEGVQVIITIGNHERPDSTTFCTEDSSFYGLKGFPGIHIADRVLDMKWQQTEGQKEATRFIFAPYVAPGMFHELLDTLDEKVMSQNKPACIFCHQEFRNAAMGAYKSKLGDEWPESNPLIISGHIHTFQQLQPNIIYAGTPYQQSFSDDGKKGILICEFASGKTPSINFLELEIRKKRTFKLKPSEINSFVPPPNCDIKIDIVGNSSEIKALNTTGIITTMRSKGIHVSLGTEKSINPANPENKPFKSLLLDMIREDADAIIVFNELFAPQTNTMIFPPRIGELTDLLRNAQAVGTTKISSDPSQLLNSLVANAKGAGFNYSVPNGSPGFGQALSQTGKSDAFSYLANQPSAIPTQPIQAIQLPQAIQPIQLPQAIQVPQTVNHQIQAVQMPQQPAGQPLQPTVQIQQPVMQPQQPQQPLQQPVMQPQQAVQIQQPLQPTVQTQQAVQIQQPQQSQQPNPFQSNNNSLAGMFGNNAGPFMQKSTSSGPQIQPLYQQANPMQTSNPFLAATSANSITQQAPSLGQVNVTPTLNASQMNALQNTPNQLLQTLQGSANSPTAFNAPPPNTPATLRMGGGSISETPSYLIGPKGNSLTTAAPDRSVVESLMASASAEKAKSQANLLESLIPISGPPTNQPPSPNSGGSIM